MSNLLDQTKFTNPEIEYLVKGLDSNLDPKDSMSKILKTNEHVSVISDLSDKQSFDTEPVKRLSSQGELIIVILLAKSLRPTNNTKTIIANVKW